MAEDEMTDEAGLLGISISDSDGDGDGDVDTSHGIASSKKGRDRTGQSEAAFQAVKAEYRAKLENGETWKSVRLPLGLRRVPKHEGQELLHAVEELYFLRRFDEAVSFVGRVFEGEGGGDGLDKDVRDTLRAYETRCLGKLGRLSPASG